MSGEKVVTYDDGVMTVTLPHQQLVVVVNTQGTTAFWQVYRPHPEGLWTFSGFDEPLLDGDMPIGVQRALLMALFAVQQELAGGRLQSGVSDAR
jgi:hypothetical protein